MVWALSFALFALVCSVLAFTRHPIWGFYFYLGSMYVHPPSRWWGYQLPDLRWAMLSAVVTVLAVLLHRGKLKARPMWLTVAPAALLALYDLLLWVQTAWAVDFDTHVNGAGQFFKYLIALWFVYRICDSVEKIRGVLWAHVLGCGLLGIYARFTPREMGRLDGVGGPGIDDANTLGMYLATALVSCMALFLLVRGWRRWALLPLVVLIGNGFVLANSRGATVGLVGGVLVLAICCAGLHRRSFVGLMLVSVIGAGMLIDKTFVDRLFTIGDVVETSEDADASARSRRVIVQAQLRMAADHPFGVGHRGTATLSPLYMDERWLTYAQGDGTRAERASHNTFMTVLVEQGVFGVLLYGALLIWLAGTMLRLRRRQRDGDREAITLGGAACAAIVVVLVGGMGTDYLLAEVQFWMYAVLAAALQLAEKVAALPAPSALPAAPGALRGAPT